MLFDYAYRGSSSVASTSAATAMSFVPDANREPTFFVAELRQKIEFREAISALHDIVVADLRFKPKDKTAYKEWAAARERIDWQEVAALRTEKTARIRELQTELSELDSRKSKRWDPFYKARKHYYDYLYKKNLDLWFILDPVITVHPDEVFFECFSEDESSYGRLGANYDVFEKIREFACGTTNIDYSNALYDEFQKIRTYKKTKFEIDPRGFELQTTDGESFREVKIDLPDSWVRGFLQVSSAMTLPTVSFELDPLDVYNICFVLRRRKERESPRSMRYILKPGEPVKIVFEPWNLEVVCARSRYEGAGAHEIRVWGRRRLLTLERLIAVARKFTVHLLGTGLPSFYIADLGDLNFTLGLSGWTANDWSKAGNFDLLAPRFDTDEFTKRRVFEGLRENWRETPEALAGRLGLDKKHVLGALAAYTQAGRAIYDLNKGVYRVRELSREPLPMEKLRFANEREAAAARFLEEKAVSIKRREPLENGARRLAGTVKDGGRTHNVSLVIDSDERLADAACDCYFFATNRLFQGPCEHLLALRRQENNL
ncbi:MAG: SWIM zinc finger family protein [Acidobacteria bacterium]|nr:SWIM zinc finger family protein [Acidobacteriota bacterium]